MSEKPTTENVLKWAREAGFQDWAVYGRIERKEDCLNYFAALAYAAGAAAEREKLQLELNQANAMKCTSPWPDSPPCRGIDRAVAAERDAIADAVIKCDPRATLKGIAAAIRAKREKNE